MADLSTIPYYDVIITSFSISVFRWQIILLLSRIILNNLLKNILTIDRFLVIFSFISSNLIVINVIIFKIFFLFFQM